VAEHEAAPELATEEEARGVAEKVLIQTMASSGTREISPSPATTPPRMTVNSPPYEEADERTGLEEGERSSEEVSPRAEGLGELREEGLRVRRAREDAARIDREHESHVEHEHEPLAPSAPRRHRATTTIGDPPSCDHAGAGQDEDRRSSRWAETR
jgi:hypothetical protein